MHVERLELAREHRCVDQPRCRLRSCLKTTRASYRFAATAAEELESAESCNRLADPLLHGRGSPPRADSAPSKIDDCYRLAKRKGSPQQTCHASNKGVSSQE